MRNEERGTNKNNGPGKIDTAGALFLRALRMERSKSALESVHLLLRSGYSGQPKSEHHLRTIHLQLYCFERCIISEQDTMSVVATVDLSRPGLWLEVAVRTTDAIVGVANLVLSNVCSAIVGHKD